MVVSESTLVVSGLQRLELGLQSLGVGVELEGCGLQPRHALLDLVHLFEVGLQLPVLVVELLHSLGNVGSDLPHIGVFRGRHPVHLLQQLVLLRGGLELALPVSTSIWRLERKGNDIKFATCYTYLHPLRRLGEHERGEVVELRIVWVERLERRCRRRESRHHLRPLRSLLGRRGIAHGR